MIYLGGNFLFLRCLCSKVPIPALHVQPSLYRFTFTLLRLLIICLLDYCLESTSQLLVMLDGVTDEDDHLYAVWKSVFTDCK